MDEYAGLYLEVFGSLGHRVVFVPLRFALLPLLAAAAGVPAGVVAAYLYWGTIAVERGLIR